MKKLNARIYKVTEKDNSIGVTSWDLLTVDGESPKETVYFMKNDDMPSYTSQTFIVDAVDNEEWEELNETPDLSEFDIDASVFDTAGEDYQEIRELLKNISND